MQTTELFTKQQRLYGWISTITVALFFFYEFIQLSLFNSIDKFLMIDFAVNATQLSQLSASYFYGNALLLLPAGIMLDKFSTKKLVFLNSLLCSLATVVFAWSNNYWLALAARFCVGSGGAFCFVSCIRIASRWFPAKNMALVTGVILTIGMLGGMASQIPFALLSNNLGWRYAVLLDGALGLLIMAAVLCLVKDQPDNAPVRHSHKQRNLRADLVKVMCCQQNWLGGCYASLMNFPVVLLGALWGIHYLVTVHNLTEMQAAYITTIYFAGMIIGVLFYGWCSDALGLRRLPMIIGPIVSLPSILCLMLLPQLSFTAIASLFCALGISISSQVLVYPTVAELNPFALTATAASIVSFLIVSGAFVVQPLFGWLMQHHWQQLHYIADATPAYNAADFNYAMWLIPISLVLALLAACFIKETRCQPMIINQD
jgi:MFS family permease